MKSAHGLDHTLVLAAGSGKDPGKLHQLLLRLLGRRHPATLDEWLWANIVRR